MKVATLFVFLSFLLACGKQSEPASDIADVGLLHTEELSKLVLYAEYDMVFMKKCHPNAPLPLNRQCAGSVVAEMRLETYLEKLPYETGPYAKSDGGKAILNEMIAVVQADADAGKPGASERLRELRAWERDMVKVLRILSDLKDPDAALTYLEYQKEYKVLRQPFSPEANLPANEHEVMAWFESGRVPDASIFQVDRPLKGVWFKGHDSQADFQPLKTDLFTVMRHGQKYFLPDHSVDLIEQFISPMGLLPYNEETGALILRFPLCDFKYTFREARKLGSRFLIGHSTYIGDDLICLAWLANGRKMPHKFVIYRI